jgi:hypothetical protein
MADKSKNHATHIPESKSAFCKLFELAMGPGLMLAILIALGAHLIVSDLADKLGFYAAHHHPAAP